MNYFTKLDDNQLSFGSGSYEINTDDIPEGTTNFWLTKTKQIIEGPKIFNALTVVSGSLFVKDNIYLQADGEGDYAYLCFDGSNGYIRFKNTDSEFLFNNAIYSLEDITADGSITADGDIYTNADLYINADGFVGEDSTLYFITLNMPPKTLKWAGANGQFEFSDDLLVAGDLVAGDLVASNLKSNGNIYVNYDGAAGDSYLYFYHNSSPTGEYLKWDYGIFSSTFEFSDSLKINGALVVTEDAGIYGDSILLNCGGPDGNSYLFFYEGSSPTGAYLRWNDTDTRFSLSHNLNVLGNVTATLTSGSSFRTVTSFGDMLVNGTVRANGNVYIDANGNDTNSYLYFRGGTQHLRYQYVGSAFVLSSTLAINGALNVVGTCQCDALRIDQVPATETLTCTKCITISCDGVNYKIPCVAV